MMLTPSQKKILEQSSSAQFSLSLKEISDIALQSDSNQLTDQQLVEFHKIANTLYRAGEPLISDSVYDAVFLEELRRRDPQHPFLHTVEPEPSLFGKTVQLPSPSLPLTAVRGRCNRRSPDWSHDATGGIRRKFLQLPHLERLVAVTGNSLRSVQVA